LTIETLRVNMASDNTYTVFVLQCKEGDVWKDEQEEFQDIESAKDSAEDYDITGPWRVVKRVVVETDTVVADEFHLPD
jgi:hypothetical protein